MRSVAQFPIRTVSALTGVKAITLRAWERRYGLIRPRRTSSGHRLYSEADVEQIRRVLGLLDRGIQISRVSDVLAAQEDGTRPTVAKSPWHVNRQRMLGAIARFDEEELDAVHDEVLAVHSPDQLMEELLLPALAQLGERWNDQVGGIAEEHFLATYLRSKLGARLQRPSRYVHGPRLLTACAPNEHHEIGLLLFALEARAAGCRIVLLGANNPLSELVVAHRQARSDALVISSSVGTVPWIYRGELSELVREAGVPVFVGGSTALTHRKAVIKAGAVPLGAQPRGGLDIVMSTLGSVAVRPRGSRRTRSQ